MTEDQETRRLANDVRTRVTVKFAEILGAQDDIPPAFIDKLVTLIEAEGTPSADDVVSVLTTAQEGEQESD